MKLPVFRTLLTFMLILILFKVSALAQSPTKISGVLIGADQKPLEYIHVYSNSGIGTFSNQDGYYELVIPDEKPADSITFSAIGYKTARFTIESLNSVESDTVLLKSSLTILKELIVTPGRHDARNIMELAIKRIPKNYVKKKYSMNVFYRESNIKGERYSRMFESYALVSDKGFLSNLDATLVKVSQLRKTANNLDLTEQEKSTEYQIKNGLYKTMGHDRIKLKEGETFYETFEYKHDFRWYELNRFFDEEYLANNDFGITEVFANDGDTIAVLSTKPIGINKALANYNKIYVNLSNYAIEKYIVEYKLFPDVEGGNRYSLINEDGELNFYKAHFIYREIAGRYYPHYYKLSFFGTNSNMLIDRWRKTNPSGLEIIYQQNEFFVTEILPYRKIKKREAVGKDQDIYDLNIPNDPAFWGGFKFPGNYLLSEKALEELSREQSGVQSLFIK